MKYIYISFIILFFSCNTTRKKFKVESEFIDNYDVYAWFDKNNIWALSLPISLNITNDNIKRQILYYQYNYKNSEKGKAISLYEIKGNEKLDLVENFRKKELNLNSKSTFLILTKHIVIDNKLAEEITSNLNMSVQLNDSISLGNFKKFKEKHEQMIKKLIRGDTLYLRFKESKGKKKKRIKVPINL